MNRISTLNGWKWNTEQLDYYVGLLQGITDPFNEHLNLIVTLDDLPAPVESVITLNGGNWLILSHLDLQGNRLVLDGTTALFGFSSETSSISSTGLLAGSVMITSTNTVPMQNLSITSPAGTSAVSFIGATGLEALDWRAVNFVNCETIGTVSNYSNFIMQDSAFLNSAGFTLGSSVGTGAFESCFFLGSAGTLISLPASLVITRRFRVIYSSFVVLSGNVGINLSTSASIPVEGYILDTVNFSGGGDYLSGVQFNDNKSLFSSCKGINNSNTVADVRIANNATPTPIAQKDVAYKLLGEFSLNPVSQRFEVVDNKVYYRGAITKTFAVSVVATLSSGNNNEIGMYIAKNGVPLAESEFYTTMNGNGRAENSNSRATIPLSTNDYLDVYVENETAAVNILGEYVSLWATPATN